MKKLLWISDSPFACTGMGRVTKECCSLLASKYEVVNAGWNQQPGTYIQKDGFSCHGVPKYKDEFEFVSEVVKKERPDIIFCFGDQWDFDYLAKIRKQYPNIITSCYINIDSKPVSDSQSILFKNYDSIIVSSEFAKKALLEKIPTRKIEVAYHGINNEKYFRYTDELRSELRKMQEISDDYFVVGFLGRNQTRKNIPSLIKAFSKFQEDKDDVFLFFSSDIHDRPNSQVKLDELIYNNIPREKIKIFATSSVDNGHNKSDAEINNFYNILDVYASCAYAEGQGMPIMESMITGAIPVVPNDYCMPEIAKHGLLVPVKTHITLESERNFAVVDEYKFSQALESLYLKKKKNPVEFKKLQEQQIEYAKSFKWIDLAKTIHRTLEETKKDTIETISVFG